MQRFYFSKLKHYKNKNVYRSLQGDSDKLPKVLTPKAEFVDEVLSTEDTITTSEVAKMLGIKSANSLTRGSEIGIGS